MRTPRKRFYKRKADCATPPRQTPCVRPATPCERSCEGMTEITSLPVEAEVNPGLLGRLFGFEAILRANTAPQDPRDCTLIMTARQRRLIRRRAGE